MTKARLVMRMGRSRSFAAAIAASNASIPAPMQSSANFTMRIAFFADTPIVVMRPTCR